MVVLLIIQRLYSIHCKLANYILLFLSDNILCAIAGKGKVMERIRLHWEQIVPKLDSLNSKGCPTAAVVDILTFIAELLGLCLWVELQGAVRAEHTSSYCAHTSRLSCRGHAICMLSIGCRALTG
jgi:hypothetical protein